MAFYGVEYKFDKSERFEEFLRVHGVPEDKIAGLATHKPTQKITKNGDSYTITTSTPKGQKETTFKSGVEFDDVIGDDNLPIKTSYSVDGNTITQVIKAGPGAAIFKREFNGNDLVVTITADKFDGVAKRYYKA